MCDWFFFGHIQAGNIWTSLYSWVLLKIIKDQFRCAMRKGTSRWVGIFYKVSSHGQILHYYAAPSLGSILQ